MKLGIYMGTRLLLFLFIDTAINSRCESNICTTIGFKPSFSQIQIRNFIDCVWNTIVQLQKNEAIRKDFISNKERILSYMTKEIFVKSDKNIKYQKDPTSNFNYQDPIKDIIRVISKYLKHTVFTKNQKKQLNQKITDKIIGKQYRAHISILLKERTKTTVLNKKPTQIKPTATSRVYNATHMELPVSRILTTPSPLIADSAQPLNKLVIYLIIAGLGLAIISVSVFICWLMTKSKKPINLPV